MKKIAYVLLFAAGISACKQSGQSTDSPNQNFASLCEQYYQEGLKLNPLSATSAGDERIQLESR
jgi:hypothetical protein